MKTMSNKSSASHRLVLLYTVKLKSMEIVLDRSPYEKTQHSTKNPLGHIRFTFDVIEREHAEDCNCQSAEDHVPPKRVTFKSVHKLILLYL